MTNIVIRKAVENDLSRLYELGFTAYTQESLASFEMNLSEDKLKFVGEQAIKGGWSFVLVIDDIIVGCMLGAINPMMISDALVYGEIMFFIDEPYRKFTKTFIKKIECELINNGVSKFVLANIETNGADKIDRFYSIMGFKKMETHYMKSLN
uniref:N-acetyltransferase domain-containing protein n=1 Tax=viral metagenome TaxID=1070528 RepID=A0A6M3KVM0_9ZZZZ